MYSSDQLHRTLFLDIETVSGSMHFSQLDERWQSLWTKKHKTIGRFLDPEISPEESYGQRAAIYSEFGKIVCISLGLLSHTEDGEEIRLKTLADTDERVILSELSELLDSHYPSGEQYYLCGHNIREFDIPYIARRMLIQDVKIPSILEVRGRKPWELKHFVDTLELWKFGDYKSFISLDMLTQVLGVSSPKNAMDGSEVGEYYWHRDGLDEICAYCERDVVAVIQVLRRMCGLEQVAPELISFQYPQPDRSS